METREITMYDNKVWGYEVSQYGLEHGRLDYATLAEMVGACIFNTTIREAFPYDWEVLSGECENEISQEYIISESGYRVLRDYTNELVLYNDTLDIYIWAVDHIGTSWNYVLTDIKLIEG